jgi:branched-chain amino acid transport system substrate-binding protein
MELNTNIVVLVGTYRALVEQERSMLSEKKEVTRRNWIKYAGAGAVVVAAAGAGYVALQPSMSGKKEIKVGCLAPLTGSLSTDGVEQPENAQMVIDNWNAKGGLLGRSITMVTRDTESQPEPATRRCKELISTEKVDFLVGTISSATQMAIHEVTREEKMIWMVSSGIVPAGRKKGTMNPYSWYVHPDVKMFAKADAKFAYENLGHTAYTVAMDYVWGRDVTKYFSEEFVANGGKIVGSDFTPLGTTDFSSLFPKIRAAKPEVLAMPLGGHDCNIMIKQIYEYGLKDEMERMSINAPTTNGTMELDPKELEGHFCGLGFYWDMPQSKEYSDEVMKRFNHPPGDWGWDVYAGLNLLFEAVEKAGSIDRDKIREELEKPFTWNFAKGDSYFRKCDHQAYVPWFIFKGKGPSEVKSKWDRLELVRTFAAKETENWLPTCEELGY